MAPKQQSGFGVVPIIVIIAAVAVLGFVGFKLLTAQSSKPANTNSTTTNNSTHPTNVQPSSTQTSPMPAQTDPYLHIKELGIKIKLSDKIKDATYALFQPQPTDGSKVIGISAQSLNDGSAPDTNVHCKASLGAIGLVTASSTAPVSVDGQPLTVDNKTLFKLGDMYYRYVGPQTACGISEAGHEVMVQLIGQKQAAFAEAFKTVQLDK